MIRTTYIVTEYHPTKNIFSTSNPWLVCRFPIITLFCILSQRGHRCSNRQADRQGRHGINAQQVVQCLTTRAFNTCNMQMVFIKSLLLYGRVVGHALLCIMHTGRSRARRPYFFTSYAERISSTRDAELWKGRAIFQPYVRAERNLPCDENIHVSYFVLPTLLHKVTTQRIIFCVKFQHKLSAFFISKLCTYIHTYTHKYI